jgi:hypothetical protein
MVVARLVSRLLYFLFSVATCRLVALIALATVVPPVPGPPCDGSCICNTRYILLV